MGQSLALIAATLLAVHARVGAARVDETVQACHPRLCGVVLAQAGEPASKPPTPAPTAWKSFEVRSTLTYAAAPKRPHRLIATYVFPDKARWWLEAGEPNHIERIVQYRSADRAYEIGKRGSTSEELTQEARRALFGQMELRRALVLWPGGVDWRGDGKERTADLGELGTLWCRLAPETENAPAELGLRDLAGVERIGFRGVKWRATDGQLRAASAEFCESGQLVWTETIDSVQAPVAFIDAFFLPPDRRLAVPSELDTGKIEHVDLPEFWGQRIALGNGLTWEQALGENQRLRKETEARLAPLGLELDRMVTIEVSDDLRPQACILRLAKEPTTSVAGFERTRTRTGLIMIVSGFAELTPSRLHALEKARSETPLDARGRRAYVRFAPEQAPKGAVLIVVPLTGG